jgi:diphosphomevalonate decarboxylase
MQNRKAKAFSNPNIAFIKYWGNTDDDLRISSNGSISMNLEALKTETSVQFSSSLISDSLTLNDQKIEGDGLRRVSRMLDFVRNMAEIALFAEVISSNNFPTGSGIASSASAFAALALASSRAAGLELSEADLSRLARTGSGSASRSIPGGFVEWHYGTDHISSFSESIAKAEHWDLVDNIAVISREHKETGSSSGHLLANTSPIQAGRVADAERRIEICRSAIINKDFDALAKISELDSNLLHSVMMTSNPPLIYWQPATINIMKNVAEWRSTGMPAFYTIDAGPNVHVISPAEISQKVAAKLIELESVQEVITSSAGGPAGLIS